MTKGTRRTTGSPEEAAAAGAQAGQDPEGVRDLARRLEEPPPANDEWGIGSDADSDEPEEPGQNMEGMSPTS